MTKANVWSSAFFNSLLAWFPFLVGGLSIPLAIFIPNQAEFGYDASTIWPFVGASGLLWLVLVAVIYFRRKEESSIARGLFFVGVLMLLTDMLAPMSWGVLDGEESLSEPLKLTMIELGLLVLVTVAFFYFPDQQLTRLAQSLLVVGF